MTPNREIEIGAGPRGASAHINETHMHPDPDPDLKDTDAPSEA
jgi:hypothetical protein